MKTVSWRRGGLPSAMLAHECRYARSLAWIVAVFLAICGEANAVAIPYVRMVASRGQSAPGTTTVFDNVSSPPSINATGDVAFPNW